MKPALRAAVLLIAAGGILWWILARNHGGDLKVDREAGAPLGPSVESKAQESGSGGQSDAGETRSSQTTDAATPSPLPAQPAAALPIPQTAAEFNALADGTLSLGEKMSVFSRVMKEGTAGHAKLAAIRSIYIVRNADFVAQLQPLLVKGDVKPEAMEVLSLNLYDRPLDITLRTWALICERPGHPLQAAAADGLAFYLKDKAQARGDALAKVIDAYLTAPKK